jgi:hypothetical protein
MLTRIEYLTLPLDRSRAMLVANVETSSMTTEAAILTTEFPTDSTPNHMHIKATVEQVMACIVTYLKTTLTTVTSCLVNVIQPALLVQVTNN